MSCMKSKFAFLFALSLLLSCPSFMGADHSENVASSTYPVHNPDTGLNYATIQEAIDANDTLNGHTLLVDSGTFYEHITVSKSLSLIGADRDNTIIDGNGTGTVIRLVTFASNVTIRNFTIRNAGPNWGVGHFDACVEVANVQNVVVDNNVILNAGRCIVIGSSSLINISNNDISKGILYAVDVGISHDVTISNNFIHDYEEFGIGIDDSHYCTIINNTVENGSVGIGLGPNVHDLLVPSNNLIDGNIVSNNSEVNMFFLGARGRSQEYYTNVFRRNNLTNAQHHNLIVWGFNLASFIQDIDSSNTANNKRIYYLTNRSDLEIGPANYPDAGCLALVDCSNITVKDFDFTSNKDGLLLAGSTNCTLANMTLENNRLSLISIEANVSARSNYGGLTLFESSNNTIENCRICNSSYAVGLCRSDWNLFYHNSFVGNDKNVILDYYYPFQNISSGYFSTDFWDDGIEGNYWSDYNGTDSDHDGIGDTPYILDANNTDHHPLMTPYVIPEFPSTMLMPMYMVASLLAVIVCRMKSKETRR